MNSPALNQAMNILNLLRTTIDGREEVELKLGRMIKTIAAEIKSDAAACYVAVNASYLELFSSYGFNPEAVHKISFRFTEGLTGEVASTKRPLAVLDALSHPKFVSDDKLDEKNYKSYLGIPLLKRNRTVGVLTLYTKAPHEYTSEEIEILETVALVLAEYITSEEMSAYKKALIKERGLVEKDRIKGVSINKGYGLGNAIIHRRTHAVSKIFAEDKNKELRKLEVAHRQMNQDLDKQFNETKLGIGEHVEILDAYKMFAKDKGWYKKIADHVENGLTAEAAVERAYEDMWNRLSGSADSYLKERLHDLRDVADRLQTYLSGDYISLKDRLVGQDIIIVAKIMGPADLMDYDYKKIKGLIIEDGTPTMHVAIVAKALNIPVIAKTKGWFAEIKQGQLVAVDGAEGYVYINPSSQIQDNFRLKIAAAEKLAQELAKLRKLPSKTLDKIKIGHYINVGLSFDFDYIEKTNCDGIGLYRTEIPFMTSDAMPSVEKQISYYKELMDKAGSRKVIFRSLDVGSDKLLPYWTSTGEENPAIGWRSIRITLDRRALLRKQVRAFLRAAAGKELNVMFPMISDLTEFAEAKETLMIELEKEKKKSGLVPKKVNVGLMVEVPSVVFQLDLILDKADFISVGTNDLAQFTFACDRGNPKLTERYDVLSPPFLSIMEEIVKKADAKGVSCSVCGEMASNPLEAMALIGLGYRQLSSAGASYGRVKSMIRSLNVAEVSDYIRNLLRSSQKTLRPQLMAYAYDHGIEIF